MKDNLEGTQMAKRSAKLKWKRVKHGFDLQVLNPKDINVNELRKLLLNVETSSANWRKDMHFDQRASKVFREWFSCPSMPLPTYAYAKLSNWFLTHLEWVRESPRGRAALELWKVLFCAVPNLENRLTDTKKNYKILQGEFDLWWTKQQTCQKDC